MAQTTLVVVSSPGRPHFQAPVVRALQMFDKAISTQKLPSMSPEGSWPQALGTFVVNIENGEISHKNLDF